VQSTEKRTSEVSEKMSVRKPKYKTLRELLTYELVIEEDSKTSELIRSLRHVRQTKFLTKSELIAICKWKSPRAIRHIKRNSTARIRNLTHKALITKSERERIKYLTSLHGVSLPMASAILTLVNPRRYGVIDIRVWQLLFAIKSVSKNPRGTGLTFKNWYHYLSKLRYHAKELGITVRAIDRTLFFYHRKLQMGALYDFRKS
jgi:hypothetical protein